MERFNVDRDFECISNECADEKKVSLSFFSRTEADRARRFHCSFPGYRPTPLAELDGLAGRMGLGKVYVKDESKRFGLNAFKVLGGSYAIGRYIAGRLGEEIEALPFERMVSPEVRDRLGQVTLVTATDGNHGRGVAWTARQLGQKAVVYMPKGSARERLDNIRAEGAEATITDLNYDDAVRLANDRARQPGCVMIQDTAWEGYTDIPTWIMQGYLTMGLEIIEQLEAQGAPPPTHLFLQAGVGSMAGAMMGLFASHYGADCPITTVVEPNKAACVFATAKANDGSIHPVTGDLDTLMAGLACGEPCTIGWEVLRDYAHGFLSCPDYAAETGMRILSSPTDDDPRVISGESGAATVGCVAEILADPNHRQIRGQLGLDRDSRVVFISTEGDTDKENFLRTVWSVNFDSNGGNHHAE